MSLRSPILRRVAPTIAGINSKKEKRAARTGSIPNIFDIAIVDPERETPGKIANPWKKPINNAFLIGKLSICF